MKPNLKWKEMPIEDPRKSGIPIDDIIRKELRDPKYRREFLRFSVRIEIAAAIKHLRLSRGLTQKQLAARARIPQSQIGRIEGLSDARIPSLDQLVNILAALDGGLSLVLRPSQRSRRGAREIVLA
jgi:predicted XRE-type DNA-binding protein